MKIIFLDIDGVLALMHKKRDSYGSLFHESFVDNLKSIIDATGAKIVISSTWRMSGLKIMQEMWIKRNLPGEVIDITPYGMYTLIKGIYSLSEIREEKIGVERGSEIEYWLKAKKFQRINWSKEKQIEYLEKSEIKNYVILDDDLDMLLSQYEHFVKTSNQWDELDALEGYGLTKSASEKTIKILNSNVVDLYYK